MGPPASWLPWALISSAFFGRFASWALCRWNLVATRLHLPGNEAFSGRRGAVGLFNDREAHAGLVTVLFRHLAPAVLGFLAALERTLDLGRAFHELVEVHRAELTADHPEIAACGHCQSPVCCRAASLEFASCSRLIGSTVSRTGSSCCGRRRLQGRFAREVFLVVVADVGAGHVLMLHAGDALADLGALDVLHIAEHALLAEIFPRQVVGGERRGVI